MSPHMSAVRTLRAPTAVAGMWVRLADGEGSGGGAPVAKHGEAHAQLALQHAVLLAREHDLDHAIQLQRAGRAVAAEGAVCVRVERLARREGQVCLARERGARVHAVREVRRLRGLQRLLRTAGRSGQRHIATHSGLLADSR